MKYRYRSEEEMKDSGVEWIGKIPGEWKRATLRWYLFCKSGDFISNTVSEKNEEGIPVIGGNGIMGYCDRYNVNDTVLAVGRVGALCGNVHLIDYPCWITDNSLIIQSISKKVDIKYLYRTLDILNLNSFSTSTAQPLITGETIKKRTICIPNMIEQKRINKFLNEKTAQFDSIISKKEVLIQRLEEAKKSLISEVVTGKVKVVKTSDGYELVERKKEEMKDSGVEWLGDIPCEWEVTKLKYNLCKIGSGKTPKGGAEVYTDSGVVFIRSQNVYNDGLRLDDVVFINEEIDKEMNNSRVEFNDVLLNITGGSIGRSSLVDNIDLRANVNQHVCILRPITYRINPNLLHTIIQSNATQLQIQALQNGSNREGLNFEQIANIVMVKSKKMQEQELVVEYIKNITDNIYIIISKTKQQIGKLKQAKQSLISEAVTGKIEILD